MKITDVVTVLLTGPCTNDPFLLESRKRRSAAFIEIHTDSEHIGIGETYDDLRPFAAREFAAALIADSELEDAE